MQMAPGSYIDITCGRESVTEGLLPFLRKNNMSIFLEAMSTSCLVPWHGMSINLST